eukprot:m.61000 g.61000  ORF g.61000 m.61000 type:complete len:150 (-) comp13318_c0_seq1:41-490(-)
MSLSLFNDPFFNSFDLFPLRRLGHEGGHHHQHQQQKWNMLGSCDIVETKDAHVFTLDTPGMSKEDVKIECENDILTISGERKSHHEEKDDKVHRVERHYGSFKRSFRLPDGVDPTAIKAKFDAGTLRVEVPKPPEEAKRSQVHHIAISD